MLSSFVYGFSVGKIIVMRESKILEYKTRVNELFLNDKNFVAVNENIIAKKEFDKYMEENDNERE